MSIEPWINCRDIGRSIRFYTEILDFELFSPPDPDPSAHGSKHALLRRDGFIVHLDSHAGDKGPFGVSLLVRVPDVDVLYRRFCANGLNVGNRETPPALRGGPIDQSCGLREIWLADPDGNILTFGQKLTVPAGPSS